MREVLHKVLIRPLFAVYSVPSEEIFHWANVSFSERRIAQPCKRTTSETFQAVQGLCDIYTILIWNVVSAQEWDFSAQMVWWYCAVAYLRRNIGCDHYWFQRSQSVNKRISWTCVKKRVISSRTEPRYVYLSLGTIREYVLVYLIYAVYIFVQYCFCFALLIGSNNMRCVECKITCLAWTRKHNPVTAAIWKQFYFNCNF